MKEKILSIIVMTVLLIGIVGVTTVNAASSGISISAPAEVKIGDDVSVTVYFSPAVPGAQLALTYNSSVLRYKSDTLGGTASGGSVEVIHADPVNASTIGSVTFYFEAIAEGTTNFKVNNAKLSDEEGGKISISYNNGASTTVSKKEEPINPDPVDPNPPVNPDPVDPNPPVNPDPVNPNPPVNPDPVNPNPGTPNDEPTFRNDNSKVYATSNVNIRSSWTTAENNILGMLKKGEEITRTGISSGWDRVTYNGKTAYIRHGYLTTEKPDENEEDNNGENETPVDDNQVGVVDPIENETNVTENNSVGGEDTVTNKPVVNNPKKNGKILAIVCSIIAIVVAGIIIFIIYKKTNDDEDEEEEENTSKANTRNNTIKNTTARTSTTRNTTRTTGTKNTTTKRTTSGKKE